MTTIGSSGDWKPSLQVLIAARGIATPRRRRPPDRVAAITRVPIRLVLLIAQELTHKQPGFNRAEANDTGRS
jgi:hypothetical protein